MVARPSAARPAAESEHPAWPLEIRDIRQGTRLTGMTAPMVLDGPMTVDCFLADTEQVLAPRLSPGDIVIMDNLPAHRGAAVREAIEAVGAKLLFLPALLARLQPDRERRRQARRRSSAKPPSAPSISSGPSSAIVSTPSHPPNAPTTLDTLAMMHPE